MRKIYNLKGLDCAACTVKLEKEIKQIVGVEDVKIDFLNLKLILEVEEENISDLLLKIQKVIHDVEPEVVLEEEKLKKDERNNDEPIEKTLKKEILFILISFFLFLFVLIKPFSSFWISIVFYGIIYWIVGGKILWKALKNIIQKKFLDENFLMSIATIGAFAIGEYSEAIAVMLFYRVGEFFQKYAVHRSKKSIVDLMDLRSDYVNVVLKDEIIKTDPMDVSVGDVILVEPGEKVPLDGIILEGESFVDMKALTGESVPRHITVDDAIFSGSVNQNGVLKIKVTSNFQTSTATKILEMVENASSKKTTSENFITKFARYYTPIVVVLSILLVIFPPLFSKNTTFSIWLYRALSFLVVSCPCALVISIPLSFFGGIGLAAKHGILLKGSNYLEMLSKLDTLVFDKTGTITKGVFKVQKIHAIDITEEELLRFVSAAEIYSNHPIAKSIQEYYSKKQDKKKIEQVKEIAGCGIQAIVDGKQVLVGNERLMKKYHILIEKPEEIGTVLYVAIDKKYVGYLLISDEIKSDACHTMKQLKHFGIKKIIMLTGDKKEIGENVAEQLEMDEVYTELLPLQKVEKMEVLLSKKTKEEPIAFVGDGINDAPVLAISDLGIAMGGLGSDAAIEAADMVIMTDELEKIIDGIQISKKTLKIVKQNIWFCIIVKVMVLIFSALGMSTMWNAVFADVGVSVLAILNSLRLLRMKI